MNNPQNESINESTLSSQGSLVKQRITSKIASYQECKDILIKEFEQAPSEERKEILSGIQQIQDLERTDIALTYARMKMAEEERNSLAALWGSGTAVMLGIGLLYLFPAQKEPGLVFMALGIAKLLGYSIQEVALLLKTLLDSSSKSSNKQ